MAAVSQNRFTVYSLIGIFQMHNLLELMKKEQDIYNLVFHELIRQVGCAKI